MAPPPPPPAPEPTPVVYYEPEPEPTPVPAPAPAPVSTGGKSWKELVPLVERELDIATGSLITDEFSVNGSVRGDELLLRVMPGFYMDMINTPSVLDVIRRVSGLKVRVEELSYASGGSEDKLDALSQFNNVTIQ